MMQQENALNVVVDDRRVWDAWVWFRTEINARPTAPERVCIYDQKKWGNSGAVSALTPCQDHVESLGILYLFSQFQDSLSVFDLVNCAQPKAVSLRTRLVEPDIKRLIDDQRRFRWALSEHLAFWVSLAVAAKTPGIGLFVHSLPNYLPEDKGADGVSATIPANSTVIDVIEYHSVKNSISDPSPLLTP